MRSCLHFIASAAIYLAALANPGNAAAQSVIPGGPNSNRPAAPAQPIEAAPRAALPERPILVSKNATLTPGAEVSFSVKEDGDEATRIIIGDDGGLELPIGLGRVPVAGLTASGAAAAVKSHLESKYYHTGKATVSIGVNSLPAGAVKRNKVTITGKVNQPGVIEFLQGSPKKFSEALLEAGTSLYSNLKAVRVTRGDSTKTYDATEILEKGQTQKDFNLADGDLIHVPPRGIVF